MIAPGVEISLDALTSRGAKLPRVDLVTPRSVIGKGTVDAIRSGHRLRLRRPGRRHRHAGSATSSGPTPRRSPPAASRATVVPSTETIDEVDDLLTLTGLRLMYERNA